MSKARRNVKTAEYLTTTEAARILDVPVSRVRELASDKTLHKAIHDESGRWLIPLSSVNELKQLWALQFEAAKTPATGSLAPMFQTPPQFPLRD